MPGFLGDFGIFDDFWMIRDFYGSFWIFDKCSDCSVVCLIIVRVCWDSELETWPTWPRLLQRILRVQPQAS